MTPVDRSARAEVRNPLLLLPAIERIKRLPPPMVAALRQLLIELRADSLARAEKSWRGHKAPMALYWKAVGVYAGHLARALA